MKIMSNHNSATERDERPHTNNSTNNHTISDALKRRAQSVINDKSIDAGTRGIIRYGLETDDPWLPELVRRVEAGETIIDNMYLLHSSKDKVEALADLICSAGEQSAAALLVLMATLESATDPNALANAAKHLAFTRCGELNVFSMVDAQIAIFEDKLLEDHAVVPDPLLVRLSGPTARRQTRG
jgi:hypothetical protein